MPSPHHKHSAHDPREIDFSIIVPCFNEAGNIRELCSRISRNCMHLEFEIIFVDDGSTDTTALEIRGLQELAPNITLVSLLHNAGHQNALRAGLQHARGKFVATIDADLQHPPELLPKMYAKAQEGYDVVSMVNEGIQKGRFKNICSKLFYRIFNKISDIKITPDASDFRLFSRRVCNLVNSMPERGMVLRALIPSLGFPGAVLHYEVNPRYSGTNSYTFGQSMRLALDSIFNFTTFPLRAATIVGGVFSISAFMYGVFAVLAKIFADINVPGYTDIIASVLFLNGLILLFLGTLGHYIEVILDHQKMRPEYIVASVTRLPTPHQGKPAKINMHTQDSGRRHVRGVQENPPFSNQNL